ncbi:MAG: hypothetical protein RLZZ628_508 [Bacteroidota bacterium]|jgi:hypothetical protein
MKKSLLFSTLFFIFVAQLQAQLTTNRWYGPNWGWVAPAYNDHSSELYRSGSLSIVEPCCGDASTIQGKGYIFFDGQNTHWEWDNPNYGLSIAKFAKLNISQSDSYAWNNLGVVLSGYGGVSLRTQNGAFMVHQNGIISMGLAWGWRDQAKVRELSKKDPNIVAYDYAQGYTLYVRQGIVTEKIKVANVANWPDYVFRKGYPLLTLSQVDTFIQAKGHLPNTPSAEVIENQGLELGATAKNHQEKIEELFLHLIEMEKRLRALETENARLKTELHPLKQ